LAEVLLDAEQRGRDIADEAVLKRYEAMRRHENLKMMTVMDVFYQSFSNDILPVKLVRNLGLGLALAQRLTPVRNKVMKAAMGLEGRLPRLARGEGLSRS